MCLNREHLQFSPTKMRWMAVGFYANPRNSVNAR